MQLPKTQVAGRAIKQALMLVIIEPIVPVFALSQSSIQSTSYF